MGKGAPIITNSLYKISDQIAQATNPAKEPKQESAPAPEPEKQNEKEISIIEEKFEFSKAEIQEFNRMRHDLEMRIEGNFSRIQADTESLELKQKDLLASMEIIRQLQTKMPEIKLPDEDGENPKNDYFKFLRTIELMRLETIRIEKKMEAGAHGDPAGNSGSRGFDLINTPRSEIMKAGFAFFFPLGLFLLLCTVIMGLAFIVAWKVAL